MGAWQADWPAMPIALGLMCVLLALLFALARGYGGYVVSAWAIPVFGVAWAVFWIGFLRVGAQSALLLGPAGGPAAAGALARLSRPFPARHRAAQKALLPRSATPWGHSKERRQVLNLRL